MRINKDKYADIFSGIKGKIKFAEPLSAHTTFKIGGPARFIIEPYDLVDLKALVKLFKKNKIEFLIIGRGSNILADDRGINSAVIRLCAPFFKEVVISSSAIKAGAGSDLCRLIASAQSYGLSGLEFLAGIPGSLGGALSMNAGAWGESLGNLVAQVKVMDYNAKIKVLKKKDLVFGYRKSNLGRYIILEAVLDLKKADKKGIRDKIDGYIKSRRKAQDWRYPSCGCFFKNPANHSAGKLIDLCGLKGKRIGGAEISRIHGNFILNVSSARAKDVMDLASLAQKEVKTKFGLKLKPEVRIWMQSSKH